MVYYDPSVLLLQEPEKRGVKTASLSYTRCMNVLFVCRANVGRSQIAASFYGELHHADRASAGTIVDNPGQLLKDRPQAKNVVRVMQEHGIDMSGNVRTQIDESIVSGYDTIIVMAEPHTVPSWLEENPKTVMWSIEDPKDKNLRETRRIVAIIEQKVRDL
jgi:protein-tyrosine-phosphatase